MRKLAEVLSEDEMEDLQESLMDVLRKVKKNAKKRNTDNPPVKITNHKIFTHKSEWIYTISTSLGTVSCFKGQLIYPVYIPGSI